MRGEALIVGAFYLFMVVTIVLAIGAGGRAERLGACLLGALLALQIATEIVVPPRLASPAPSAVLVDLIGFGGFTAIGLKSRRFWPLIAAALQLLSLFSHFARALALPVAPGIYAFMKSGPTFFVLVALLLGTLFYQRRKRRATRAVMRTGSTSVNTATSITR